MKKYLILAFACLAAFGCDESAIDPLAGTYPVPQNLEFATVAGKSEEKLESGLRTFAVKLECAEGTFDANFTADKYFLVPKTYTFSESAGTDGTYFNTSWTPKGGSAVKVKSGDLKVSKADDNYEFKAALTLTDSKVIKVHFKGELVYEPVIEALRLPALLSASAQAQADGSNIITVKAGTSGITATPGEYGVTIAGNGNYISIDFVSSDATLHEGTYTPAANGEAKSGNYVMGYDTEMWGMQFYNWGTCWFTVANDAATGIHIESGDITVSKKGTAYTITVKNDDIFAEYVGELGL